MPDIDKINYKGTVYDIRDADAVKSVNGIFPSADESGVELTLTDITNLPLTIAQGGTGGTSAETARENLNASRRPIKATITLTGQNSSVTETVYDERIYESMYPELFFEDETVLTDNVMITVLDGEVTLSTSLNGTTDVTVILHDVVGATEEPENEPAEGE